MVGRVLAVVAASAAAAAAAVRSSFSSAEKVPFIRVPSSSRVRTRYTSCQGKTLPVRYRIRLV